MRTQLIMIAWGVDCDICQMCSSFTFGDLVTLMKVHSLPKMYTRHVVKAIVAYISQLIISFYQKCKLTMVNMSA